MTRKNCCEKTPWVNICIGNWTSRFTACSQGSETLQVHSKQRQLEAGKWSESMQPHQCQKTVSFIVAEDPNPAFVHMHS